MQCPYCGEYVSDRAVERNDGCCPNCATFIDHEELDEDEQPDVRDDEDDYNPEDFGLPEAGYNRDYDEFDEFLEEEEEYEKRQQAEQAHREQMETAKKRRRYATNKKKE